MSSSATMSSYSTLAASHLTQKDSHPVVKKIKVESYPDVEVFPLYWAKNRLGNEYPPIRGTPNRGPGTYNNHLRNSIVQNMKEKPLSNYGYVLGARTQRRFTQVANETPSPANYQNKWTKDKVSKQVVAPFGFSLPKKRKSPGKTWSLLVPVRTNIN
eukprot:gi/632963169/ref/XP_007897732.1/ PREDICTED: protein pitchfork-like [Callorhinchus milii]